MHMFFMKRLIQLLLWYMFPQNWYEQATITTNIKPVSTKLLLLLHMFPQIIIHEEADEKEI